MPPRPVAFSCGYHHRPAKGITSGHEAWTPPVALSPAEQAVVAEVCQGLTNREIGARLGKSEFTVKNQVSTILRKVGLPTRGRLIAQWRGNSHNER